MILGGYTLLLVSSSEMITYPHSLRKGGSR